MSQLSLSLSLSLSQLSLSLSLSLYYVSFLLSLSQSLARVHCLLEQHVKWPFVCAAPERCRSCCCLFRFLSGLFFRRRNENRIKGSLCFITCRPFPLILRLSQGRPVRRQPRTFKTTFRISTTVVIFIHIIHAFFILVILVFPEL